MIIKLKGMFLNVPESGVSQYLARGAVEYVAPKKKVTKKVAEPAVKTAAKTEAKSEIK